MKKKLLLICLLFIVNLIYCQNPLIKLNNPTSINTELLEGESINVAISLDFAIDTDVIINTSGIEITASNNDFTISNSTITIPAGDLFTYFTILINDDVEIENDLEYFKYQISVVSNNTFNTTLIGELSIKDNDIPPLVFSTQNLKNENSNVIQQKIELDRKYNEDVVIDLFTTQQTANNLDFNAITTSVTIPAGDLFVWVPITLNDDNIIESNETFLLTGNIISNNTTNNTFDVQIEIIDNDTIPTLIIEESSNSEGINAILYFYLNRPFNAPVNIQINTTYNSATVEDFNAFTGYINFQPGETMTSIEIPIINDDLDENTESFYVNTLVTSNNTTNISDSAIHYIRDNDGKPAIIFNKGYGTSGEEGNTAKTIIWLDYEYFEDITLDIYQSNGTASNLDYTSTPASLTIPAGEQFVLFNDTPLIIDQDLEGPETIYFNFNVTSGNTDNISDTLEFTINDVYELKANIDEVTAIINSDININVLANDYLHGLQLNPGDVTISFPNNDYYNANLNNDGSVNIPNTLPVGNHEIDYQICDINNPNICDTSTLIINIINPLKVTYTQEFVDYNNDNYTNVGDIILFKFNVQNLGTNQITNIQAYDSNSPITVQGGPINNLNFNQTDSTTLFAEYLLTQNDIDLGYYPNHIKNLANVKFSANYGAINFLVNPIKINEVDLDLSDGFKLNAFIDSNQNGIFDNEEIEFPFGQFNLTINDNSSELNKLYTNPYYIYESSTENSYDINYNIDESLSSYFTNQTSFENQSIVSNNGIVTYNFPIQPLEEYSDLSVEFVEVNTPQLDNIYFNKIIYTNNSLNSTCSGNITFLKDSSFQILNVSDNSVNLTNTGFSLNFSDLQPLESKEILIEMQVSDTSIVQIGDYTQNTVNINSSIVDIDTNNNSSHIAKFIENPDNLNYISEIHGKNILHSNFTEDDYLMYTIYFENSGTKNALNIKITDELHNLINENTIKMVNSSHEYTLKRIGKYLEWNFSGINLAPISNNDPNLGKGFVTFKVKPYSNFSVGDVITNSANIYIDHNSPVTTSTWTTKFLETTDYNNDSFKVFPNPVTNLISIKSNTLISEIEVISILGKKVLTKKVNSVDTSINLNELTNGMYLLKLKSNNKDRIFKIIKE
ncbi:DUF7619 domain-containing protein [Mesoflavibacter profundi]|uniref:DUF7619 domain-containing protein n=1 Tax=Mesoflavibacter profundi TaxID=2708110 RepID=UPI0035197DA0